jgi:hypothetical protein
MQCHFPSTYFVSIQEQRRGILAFSNFAHEEDEKVQRGREGKVPFAFVL